MSYLKVATETNPDNVNKKLAEGWEIISTNNYVIEPPDARTQYHLGFPAEAKVEQLKKIIAKYEEFGFKDELFKKIAEENEENLEDYNTGGGKFTYDATPKFMENYEDVVHDKKVNYYVKSEFNF